ncbi:hypothetical protein QR98_0048530 [Sarcoptes scabiei]|uniref:Uncharacterized protein n=1 Tax=Sarcoptes scabiei TaxID=52283 RepID=A0A132A5Y7_SARSC|nr:hypothetical protein QR98_0048530 [Sarcoptes scabiei]
MQTGLVIKLLIAFGKFLDRKEAKRIPSPLEPIGTEKRGRKKILTNTDIIAINSNNFRITRTKAEQKKNKKTQSANLIRIAVRV